MLSLNFKDIKWAVVLGYAAGILIVLFGGGGWWYSSGLAEQYPELTKAIASLIGILMLFVKTHTDPSK